MAKVFRATFDQIYDGHLTGRYSVDQLFKTEKTHFGTLIEINHQRELNLTDGDVLDFKIAGLEVDCKYSHTGAQMLPIESFDQIILVTQADDQRSVWSARVVRVTEENRRTSENRDKKDGPERARPFADHLAVQGCADAAQRPAPAPAFRRGRDYGRTQRAGQAQ